MTVELFGGRSTFRNGRQHFSQSEIRGWTDPNSGPDWSNISQLGTANVLISLPAPGVAGLRLPQPGFGDHDRRRIETWWGPAAAVPDAGVVAGWPTGVQIAAGRLGRHAPEWCAGAAPHRI